MKGVKPENAGHEMVFRIGVSVTPTKSTLQVEKSKKPHQYDAYHFQLGRATEGSLDRPKESVREAGK